jgi:hypothetical protein
VPPVANIVLRTRRDRDPAVLPESSAVSCDSAYIPFGIRSARIIYNSLYKIGRLLNKFNFISMKDCVILHKFVDFGQLALYERAISRTINIGRCSMVIKKSRLFGVLMVLAIIVASGGLWSAADTATAATISGHVSPLPPVAVPDVTVCLRLTGQATSALDPCYTINPYDPQGNYTFTGVSDGLYLLTPVSPGYSFDKPARTVNISGGSITAIDNQPATGGSVDFAIVVTANGACGSANGQTFSSAPTSGLCSAGTASPSSLSGSGPWNWQCTGTNGGTTAYCSANPPTVITGSCGSSDGGQFSSAPTSGLCSAGTASPSSLSGSGPWSWQCLGANGGATSNCSASVLVAGGSQYTLLANSQVLNYMKLGTRPSESAYAYYKIVVGAAEAGKTIIVTMGSKDYTTMQDLVIAKNVTVDRTFYDNIMASAPKPITTPITSSGAPYMYSFAPDSPGNYLNFSYALRSAQLGDVYYILIANRSATAGNYSISYYSY